MEKMADPDINPLGGDRNAQLHVAPARMSDERRERQTKFITEKLNSKRTKLFDKYRTMFDKNIDGEVMTNEEIIRSTMGELRNTVLAFFKGGLFKEKKCEHCGKTGKGLQFDRAHDKEVFRKDVALAALRRIRPDESKPVSQREFMRAFVQEHCNVPLWYLCRGCHIAYDKK